MGSSNALHKVRKAKPIGPGAVAESLVFGDLEKYDSIQVIGWQELFRSLDRSFLQPTLEMVGTEPRSSLCQGCDPPWIHVSYQT